MTRKEKKDIGSNIMKIENFAFGNNPQAISKKSIVAYGLPMSIWFIVFVVALGDSLLNAIPIALIGVYIFLYII